MGDWLSFHKIYVARTLRDERCQSMAWRSRQWWFIIPSSEPQLKHSAQKRRPESAVQASIHS